MRKKLDTRFPAARIKKIMQADEDVGKIAMAVPVLVSKALELFLQDLCDRTYEITLQRGAKTMSSVHLKQCVQSFNVFDFLRDVVSRVPDLGSSHGGADDTSAAKRRKVIDNEDHAVDEHSKRSRMNGAGQTSTSGRGRGRGTGRGRGRGNRTSEDGVAVKHEKLVEDGLELHNSPQAKLEDGAVILESKDGILAGRDAEAAARDFDLNVDWEKNEDTTSMSTAAAAAHQASTLVKSVQEFPGWPVGDADSMAIDSNHLASLNYHVDEDEEDYDAEDYDEEE
ncbi:hypothetical protein Dimus_011832 [Dionaea muscipula]